MAARKKTAAKANAKANAKTKPGFTAEEREAMRARAREMKDEGDESSVLAKIAEMSASDRKMGEKIHALVMRAAPTLSPRLWYGMPAYSKDGKVLCFFQAAQKFKTRYATFGFSDKAALDEGNVWPTGFAVKELTAADEARIAALVKRAAAD